MKIGTKFSKLILSLLLAVALIIGLVPVFALSNPTEAQAKNYYGIFKSSHNKLALKTSVPRVEFEFSSSGKKYRRYCIAKNTTKLHKMSQKQSGEQAV